MAELLNSKKEKYEKIEKIEKTGPNSDLYPFCRVRFHNRQNENEPENVTLAVNGEILVIKRGEVVVIPKRFCETARECYVEYNYPVTDGNENKYKKVKYSRASFDLLGEGTEEEYLTMRREGTDKVIAEAAKKAAREEEE